jgi:DNA-binding NtrC family response regulator
MDPALAESLSDDFRRLARAGAALAWSDARLGPLIAADGDRALLQALVAEARALTDAPRVFALSWQGDGKTGRVSFRALAGDGETVPDPGAISHTIVGRVARDGRAAWSDDAAADARFQAAESVQMVALRSVGCVPIGAHGVLYLLDPEHPGRFPLGTRLKLTALCALAGRVLEARSQPVSRTVAPTPNLPGLVGAAPAMAELFDAVRAFAPMPWPVLVLGETGTGKEAVSRALHGLSPRSAEPFEAVNCGAIVPALAESALFGHEKGAFTGADRRREGVFSRVGSGTLFLDEVGELPAEVQVKLLRVLQEGTFARVGGERPIRFNGRVVAATLRPLDDVAQRGSFRDDLYHRLAACIIRVPSLADRRDDVPPLAAHLLERAARDLPGTPHLDLTEDALAVLNGRAYPGNVRELENVLRGAVARCLARGETRIGAADVTRPATGTRSDAPHSEATPAHATSAPPAPTAAPAHPASVAVPLPVSELDTLPLLAATEEFQRQRIYAALDQHRQNRSAAARSLGVTRQWLHRLLRRWEDNP